MSSFYALGLAVLAAAAASTTHAFVPLAPLPHRSVDDNGASTIVLFDAEAEIPETTSMNQWRRKDLFGTSLLNQTLKELETDVEFQETAKRLETVGPEQMTKEERTRRRRALDSLGVPDFTTFISQKMPNNSNVLFQRKLPTVLQINIGLYCNQACSHCHVESSPLRTEQMTAETAARCLELLKNTPSITTLDITGGAPELHEHFRFLVRTARALRPNNNDLIIIDRCNLTVLQEPSQQHDLVDFLKQHRVHIVASLPCYSQANVDEQRGHGVFDRSIAALLALNEAGYGVTDDDLKLDLVYNPGGAFLPPSQATLEQQYKKQLEENFGILFDSLYTMTNMPIKRFADYLHREKQLKSYMDLLVQNFNADTTEHVMCRDTVSVRYDGMIFDCDFNQQLGYATGTQGDAIHQGGLSVFDITSLDELQRYPIRHDNHCFGCTAGMGSS